MSAFVVFSSIGLYPVTPGRPHYAITSPVFEKTTITLPNGKTFAIIAKGASPQRKYIQKAYLDGKELDTPFVTHEDVVSGGTLELVLADLPNREWGRQAVAPQ
jgi:putative alpha-1,2-mannosidase